ncbi:PHD and RING finger domain-containing protein C126.07c isoform X2 [Galendromus occidentalis]|uniref:PHD and RING finger domain-containing protein C126.07c isoform X2 n=1 Tax=Galendromus occidentalis TaxID=34638 RepID=A0AAJ6QU38_9ACAR|nr:PHD and RING finger domain-containing protein C126.07c isoform X2 [Galendromus occidentalis]
MLGDDVLEEAHVQASSPESDRYSQYFDSIACMLCYRSDQEALLLLCDHCNDAYHCGCLSPPLPTVPEDVPRGKYAESKSLLFPDQD